MSLSLGTDLSGRVTVVTEAGGVPCGVLAKMIAGAGVRVAVLGSNEEAAGRVADEIVAVGGIIKAYKTDVPERASLEETRAKVLAELGPHDILVNGTGGNNTRANTTEEYFEIGDIEADTISFFDLDQSGIEFVFNLNFIGAPLPTQIFVKNMVERRGCTILNAFSMNAFTPLTKIPAYNGAEATISSFTQQLVVHFSKMGIRVSAMTPGFFVTKQNEKLLFNEDGTPTERAAKILAATPMERFDEAKELNGTLLYLLNNEVSGFVTGVMILMDGGFSTYSGV